MCKFVRTGGGNLTSWQYRPADVVCVSPRTLDGKGDRYLAGALARYARDAGVPEGQALEDLAERKPEAAALLRARLGHE